MTTRYAAIVTLFLVPAFMVEFLTGDMRLAVFADPLSLAILFGSYGSGAILARELTRRWQKGIASILLLGLVYGVFNEGLGTGGFFDPHFYAVREAGLENYGRWGGVNVVWALQITMFHAVYSIAVPIIAVDALFPAWADRRLLRSGGAVAGFAAVLVIVTAVQRLILTFRQPPVNPWAFALLFVLVFVLTLAARAWPSVTADTGRRRPNNLFLLISACIGSFSWLVLVPRILSAIHLPMANVLATFCEVFLASWLLLRLAGTSLDRRLALATGAEGPLMMNALTSAALVPAAIAVALLALCWRRSGSSLVERARS